MEWDHWPNQGYPCRHCGKLGHDEGECPDIPAHLKRPVDGIKPVVGRMFSKESNLMPELSFETFRVTNRTRCEEMAQPLEGWLPSQWSNALAGEAGEVCNITKKMDRIWPANQFKASWNKPEDQRMEQLREKLKRELGDVVIYADLLASREGMTLEECVRTAFNEKSKEIGSTRQL